MTHWILIFVLSAGTNAQSAIKIDTPTKAECERVANAITLVSRPGMQRWQCVEVRK